MFESGNPSCPKPGPFEQLQRLFSSSTYLYIYTRSSQLHSRSSNPSLLQHTSNRLSQMDFQSLSRKELQVLCKKNKIPANMTNVAMADALAALPDVEGIEEIGSAQSVLLSPKTTTRPIKQAIDNEPKSLVTATRTRRRAVKTVETNDNPPQSTLKTPATRTTRRKPSAAAASSVCEDANNAQDKDEEISVSTRGYTTRRRATRSVYTKKGKSMTEAFETSALSESQDANKGASENDQGNTDEILSAQPEISAVVSQVTQQADKLLFKDSEGEESVNNRDDQGHLHDVVNQVLDNSCGDVNQIQSFIVDPPKLDEADLSKSDVGEVVLPLVSDISTSDVGEVVLPLVSDISKSDIGEIVLPLVSDISESDIGEVVVPEADDICKSDVVQAVIPVAEDIFKSDVGGIVVPVAEDIFKSDVGEIVVPVAEDISKSYISEIAVAVASDISKSDVDEVVVAIASDISNSEVSEAVVSVAVDTSKTGEDISKTDGDQVIVAVDEASNVIGNEVVISPVDASKAIAVAFDNEYQSEDENSGENILELTSLEKTELLCQSLEPSKTVETQMEITESKVDNHSQVLENVKSAVEKSDSSLQVQAEIEVADNQSHYDTQELETINKSSEITAMVLPFLSSACSTPIQVPTTPKLAAASDSKCFTNQMKVSTPISSKKNATPVPKMVLKVFEDDNEVMIAAEEEKEKPSVMNVEKEKPSVMNVAEDKENNKSKVENTIEKSLKKKSVRQLKKLLKEKLVTDNGKKGNMEMEKVRPALQTLTDNCILGNEEH